MLEVIYVLFLILSGIALLILAGIGRGQSTARRVWTGIIGAAFTIYGAYLVLFAPAHYLLFFYAFILPILLIVQFFRDRTAIRGRQQAGLYQGPPPGYGQPTGYGQTASGYGQPESAYGQPGGFG